MGIDKIETIRKDEHKEITLYYDEETDSEFYLVEYTTSIEDGRCWQDEAEFDTLDEAEEFYYSLPEPSVYRSYFDENGFRWRKL